MSSGGASTSAREGLLGLHAEDVARATRRRSAEAPSGGHDRAQRLVDAAARAVPARFWIGTARGENGKTRVTFAWEPGRRAGPARARSRPARVALTAIAPGRPAVFRGAVSGAKAAAAAQRRGVAPNAGGAAPRSTCRRDSWS